LDPFGGLGSYVPAGWRWNGYLSMARCGPTRHVVLWVTRPDGGLHFITIALYKALCDEKTVRANIQLGVMEVTRTMFLETTQKFP
jgi:hypothetical protein